MQTGKQREKNKQTTQQLSEATDLEYQNLFVCLIKKTELSQTNLNTSFNQNVYYLLWSEVCHFSTFLYDFSEIKEFKRIFINCPQIPRS